MTEHAYYWVVIGRILFDDDDTVYLTDLPCTRSEAIAAFHKDLQEHDPAAYTEHGALVTHTLRSCDCIEETHD